MEPRLLLTISPCLTCPLNLAPQLHFPGISSARCIFFAEGSSLARAFRRTSAQFRQKPDAWLLEPRHRDSQGSYGGFPHPSCAGVVVETHANSPVWIRSKSCACCYLRMPRYSPSPRDEKSHNLCCGQGVTLTNTRRMKDRCLSLLEAPSARCLVAMAGEASLVSLICWSTFPMACD